MKRETPGSRNETLAISLNSDNIDMAYLLLVLTVLFWSGNFVLGRSVHDIIPPISLAFWRWVAALIILLPFGIKPLLKQRQLIRRHWKLLAFMGLLSVNNFSIFIYFALHSTTVVNTVLVNSFQPILIVFASWIGYRDKITLLQGIGIIVSLTGLIWILSCGNPSILLSFRFSAGDLWTLSAGIFIHLIPVFSAILAFILLGERFELYHLPGIVLIFWGIFMATSGKMRN